MKPHWRGSRSAARAQLPSLGLHLATQLALSHLGAWRDVGLGWMDGAKIAWLGGRRQVGQVKRSPNTKSHNHKKRELARQVPCSCSPHVHAGVPCMCTQVYRACARRCAVHVHAGVPCMCTQIYHARGCNNARTDA
eukprot:357005-Chlamydomonas_euryale.AAC.2